MASLITLVCRVKKGVEGCSDRTLVRCGQMLSVSSASDAYALTLKIRVLIVRFLSCEHRLGSAERMMRQLIV